ncbi:hypothetical protein NC651_028158 [Populus alba x Populus x berolinensis]|nr:hypothetical protein NC651_028158 [Populus alba x Populus x berolinensis]
MRQASKSYNVELKVTKFVRKNISPSIGNLSFLRIIDSTNSSFKRETAS